MNWLDRARSELLESHQRHTANTAERAPMAVSAVLHPGITDPARSSNGSNGSTLPTQLFETASAQEEFEERAAIMQFDGGLSRKEADEAAWALVSNRYGSH